MDVSGVEQMSLCICYVTVKDGQVDVCENFLGFVQLEKLHATSIADTITSKTADMGI